MSRISQLINELKKRGIQAQVTKDQAVDILRTLPPSIKQPVPHQFDDRNDYHTELMLINMQHPEIVKMPVRSTGVQKPRSSTSDRLKPVQLISNYNLQSIKINSFTNLFQNITPSNKVAIANIISSSGPLLRIRVHALVCRNSDGKLTSGKVGQTKEQMAAAIDKIIDEVNEIYKGTGIEFIFYPSADIEIRNDTKLNQDFILNASEQSKLFLGQQSTKELEVLTESYSTNNYRSQICNQYPQKLVLLFSEGTFISAAPTQGNWRRCLKCESLFFGDSQATSRCASGGQHNADLNLSYNIYIFTENGFSVDPTSADLQKGWRWCKKCQSLFFSEGSTSICPAGSQHDGSESAFYVLDFISSFSETLSLVVDNKSQDGWRWCKKCQGFFFGKNEALSNCPAGSKHSTEGSGNYVLLTNQSTARQVVMSPSHGGFSWGDKAYAKLSAVVPLGSADIESYATFAAHEIGHYLNLWHTFAQFSVPATMSEKPIQEKIDYLQGEIRKHLESELKKKSVTRLNILDALNGDLGSEVLDTPPDDSGELLACLNTAANATTDGCGPLSTCTISLSDGTTVSYTPDRSLVMSYFKGCLNFNQHFSADQATRMRKHLINGGRRSLVGVQLGDTSTPQERMCAI